MMTEIRSPSVNGAVQDASRAALHAEENVAVSIRGVGKSFGSGRCRSPRSRTLPGTSTRAR